MSAGATRLAETTWRWRTGLIVILLLALGLRLAGTGRALLFVDRPMLLDEGAYWGMARAILDGNLAAEDLSKAYMRAPGYSAVLAVFLRRFGHAAWPMELLQAILSTAVVLMTSLLALRYLGPRSALWAGWLMAIQPAVIVFTHFLLVETFFQFAVIGFLWLLLAASEAGGRGWLYAFAAGAVIGAFTLTRSQVLGLLAPVAVVWAALEWRARRNARLALSRLALAGSAAFLVLLPWLIRNIVVHDTFPLIDTLGGVNLGLSNGGRPWRQIESEVFASSPTVAGRQAYALGVARRWIMSHPGQFSYKALKNVAGLWIPEYADPYELREKFPGISDGWLTLYADAKIIWLSGVALLAIWGMFCFPHRRPGSRMFHALLVSLVLIHTASIGLAHVEGRYGYPLYPQLALLAVAGVRVGTAWRSWAAIPAALLSLVYLAWGIWPQVASFWPQIQAVRSLEQGEMLAARGDLARAHAAFERSQALAPGWSRPALELGHLYSERTPEVAEQAYLDAQARRPDDYRPFLALTRLAARHGLPLPAEPDISVVTAGLRAAWRETTPVVSIVDVGGIDPGYIMGFYQREHTEDGTSVRWSRPRAWMRVGSLQGSGRMSFFVRLRTLGNPPDRRVLALYSRRTLVGRIHPSPEWRTYHVLVPGADASGVVEVELRMPSLYLSDILPTGDRRNVGVQIDRFGVLPADRQP